MIKLEKHQVNRLLKEKIDANFDKILEEINSSEKDVEIDFRHVFLVLETIRDDLEVLRLMQRENDRLYVCEAASSVIARELKEALGKVNENDSEKEAVEND